MLQSSQDSQGAALGFDLCRCTGREGSEFPIVIQHGSEPLNLGCLFVSDYKCVRYFSFLTTKISQWGQRSQFVLK